MHLFCEIKTCRGLVFATHLCIIVWLRKANGRTIVCAAILHTPVTFRLLYDSKWETNCRVAGWNGSRPGLSLIYSACCAPLIIAACHRHTPLPRREEDDAPDLRAANPTQRAHLKGHYFPFFPPLSFLSPPCVWSTYEQTVSHLLLAACGSLESGTISDGRAKLTAIHNRRQAEEPFFCNLKQRTPQNPLEMSVLFHQLVIKMVWTTLSCNKIRFFSAQGEAIKLRFISIWKMQTWNLSFQSVLKSFWSVGFVFQSIFPLL